MDENVKAHFLQEPQPGFLRIRHVDSQHSSRPYPLRRPHLVKTLAVTGGIGSGKSTVVDMLAEKPGVRVARADDEAKRLMVENLELHEALIDRFGADTFREDGSLNRAGLAERVFVDPAEVQVLNALVHPVVRDALVDSIEKARADGARLFVYEVALITEINVENLVDGVLLVDAPVEMRIERVMARNGVSREDVVRRINHQRDPDNLRALADHVVENEGSIQDLSDSVDSLYHSILIS